MKEDISDLSLVEYDYSGKIGGDLISGDQIISKTEKLNKMIASYYGQVLGHRKGKRS